MSFFSWLFGTSAFGYIALAFAVIVVVLLIVKEDWAKIVAAIVGFLGSVVLVIFCGYNLDVNYSSKGGVWGALASVFKKPDVSIEKTLDSVKYTFSDLQFSQEYADEQDTYSVTIQKEETFLLSNGDYLILLNDTPLETERFNNSITAYFNNAFYGNNNKIKLEDTLKIDFFFYKNYTNIKLTTKGGLKAYGHWLKYFERENFELEVKEIENAYKSDADMCKVMFVTDTSNKILEFKKGSEIKLPVIEKVGFENMGWSYSKGGTKIETPTIKVSNNLVLYGIYEERSYEVKFSSRNEIIETQNIGRNACSSAPTITDEKFYGWSIDGKNTIDVSNYEIKENTTFIALYKNYVDITSAAENTFMYGSENENKVSIKVNGLKVGDKIKVKATSILVKDGREFAGGSPNSIYGWSFVGSDANHEWHEILSEGESTGNGNLTITTNSPVTTEVGRIDYYVNNHMTFYVVCEQDDFLTIKWESTVKFYIETIGLEQIFVLR